MDEQVKLELGHGLIFLYSDYKIEPPLMGAF